MSSAWPTISEVADLLQVSTVTIWRWRKAGRMPRTYRIGGVERFKPEELKEFLHDPEGWCNKAARPREVATA